MKRKPNAKGREAARRAELRRLRAAAREPRPVETVYVRTYVRRPRWQRILTATWLVIIGILIGGGVIPHVEDKPRLIEAEVAVASPPVQRHDLPWPVMTYSWAPQKDATGYQLAFFKDGLRLTLTETVEPTYSIALAPGTYQWIVWPIIRGKHTSKAIVNSEVTIP